MSGLKIERNALFAYSKECMLSYIKQFPTHMWIEWRDYDGDTLLHFSVRRGDAAATIALINAGIDINAVNCYNYGAIISAIVTGNSSILKLLIASGADVSKCAACVAFNYSNLDCIRVLIYNNIQLGELRILKEYNFSSHLHLLKCQVKRCNRAAVSILALQKLRRINIGCKYAAREIAFAIWATRENEEWE